VVAAIVFTSTATLLPESFFTTGKILTGIAVIIITLDRSLNWGARWLYHRQLRHKYLNISARISFFENLDSVYSVDEKKKYFQLIYDDLFSLRREEFSVPGVQAQIKLQVQHFPDKAGGEIK
jgi:hypothetical protein